MLGIALSHSDLSTGASCLSIEYPCYGRPKAAPVHGIRQPTRRNPFQLERILAHCAAPKWRQAIYSFISGEKPPECPGTPKGHAGSPQCSIQRHGSLLPDGLEWPSCQPLRAPVRTIPARTVTSLRGLSYCNCARTKLLTPLTEIFESERSAASNHSYCHLDR
jgi:hypothetical protein